MEIRLYYESLEQAIHYLLPLINKGLDKGKIGVSCNIKIIRRARNSVGIRNGRIKAIYQLTTPDFLITITNGTIEIPLILGEFSESVQTEDHELQRAVGGIAASVVNAIYLKISGDKTSEQQHGGNTEFSPYYIAKAMDETLAYHGYILSKWNTVDENHHVLLRDDEFKSTPAPGAADLAEWAIPKAIHLAINIPDLSNINFSEEFYNFYLQDTRYKSYLEEVSKANSISKTLSIWASRRRVHGWRRIEVEEDRIIIKINRYSHAADPDRGILLFFSSVANKKVVLTRYTVDMKPDSRGLLMLVEQYLIRACTQGLPYTFLKLIQKRFSLTANNSIDLTSDLESLTSEIFANKVLFSLVVFSDGIIVHNTDNSLKINIQWSREKLFGRKPNDFLKYLQCTLKVDKELKLLPLKQVKEEINEDEVTYVNVHQILRKNGFDVVSVSYPGAQGDLSILPDRLNGRSQQRLYIDIIAWLPSTNNVYKGDIALEEAKGEFNSLNIKEDIEKLLSFKKEPSKRIALTEALRRLGQPEPTSIVVGIAFGTDPNQQTTWKPAEVDYIVRIFGTFKWQVAFFGNRLKNCFKIIEGPVELPVRYFIVNENVGNQELL